VVVGIDKYDDPQIKPRPKAEADARALYNLFTDQKYLGVPAEDARLLLAKDDDKGPGKKATRAAFLDALRYVAKEARPTDLVLIAFIGQGGPVGEAGERHCYFLADSTFKNRAKDAVGSEEIEDALKKLKSQKFCTFLDVDFKGFKDEGSSHAIAEPTLGKTPYREFLGDDGSDDHLPLPGRVAFLATNGLSTSLDLDKHGLFTQVLLDGLKGAADKEGYEADGLVTVDELARYLNKEMPVLARKHGKTKKEKEQDHYILAGPSAHFVLTTNPDAIKANRDRLARFEKLLGTSKVLTRYTEEDGARVLLERMPTLKKRQALRKAYQGLIDGKLTMVRFKAERKDILASMELNKGEAVLFASKVMEAIDVIKDEYVRRVDTDKMVTWGIRELYDYVEEKVPADIEKDLKKTSSMSEGQLRNLLARARLHLKQREDLENHKDLNITLQRMLHKLDPHTTFIDPETKKKFDDDIAGRFPGIGVQISKDTNTDQLLVVTPIKGSPAYKAETPMSKADRKYRAGLWAGDVITTIIREVDSEGNRLAKPEKHPTKGMPLNKAVKLIVGQPETNVKLTVQREGVEKPFDVEITRDWVEVESVLGAKRNSDDTWNYVVDKKNKIGYIRLNNFARNSYRDMEAVMKELVRKYDIKGFVLDLRFNPGGLLDIAIKVTDLYIDDGLIVSIHPRGGADKATRFYGRHTDSLLDFPMVCLVNGYSASGSEIVSAALQDHRRAIIMGERSYGKGSVQNIRDFDVVDAKTREVKKAEIKLTTAAFKRPNGENLNKASTKGRDDEKWGVVPDKVVKLPTRERRDLNEHLRKLEVIDHRHKDKDKAAKEFKDRQLDAALEYLRGQIKMARRAAARKQG
jgi:C-terminal peptidase prc